MKTLDAGQIVLQERRGLALVDLVRLRTFTDRAAGTVQATHYFSGRWLRYDYGNAGTDRQFEPFLVRVSAELAEMDNVPTVDGGDAAMTRRLTLVLRNGVDDSGQRLYKTLRALNLEMAEVEWSQLFLDTSTGQGPPDLRSLAGSEHTVRYRGHIERVARVDDAEIEILCETREPQVPWIVASDASINDPRDLGSRLPIVYGAMDRVQAVGWQVGSVTTLLEPIDAAYGAARLTDISGFGGSSGTVRVGTETVTWINQSGDQLLNLGRGANGSTATVHDAGEPVVEIPDNQFFVLAGHALSALRNLYVLSPIDGQILRVSTPYGLDLASVSLIPGKTVAIVGFTATQFQLLLDYVIKAAEAAVSQQPVVQHVVSGSSEDPGDQLPSTGPSEARDGNLSTYTTLSTPTGGPVTANWDYPPPPGGGTPTGQRVKVWCGGWSGANGTISVIVNGGTIGTIPRGSTYGEFQTTQVSNRNTLTFSAPYDSNPHSVRIYEIHRVNQYGASPPTLTQQVALVSRSAAIGFELRLFADVDGPLASGGNYSVANGTLLTRAPDVIRHFLADFCGLGHSAIDATSFSASVTNVEPLMIRCDAGRLGSSAHEIASALAYCCRSNLLLEERASGSVYLLLQAGASYAFGAAVRTIDDYLSVSEEGRAAPEIFTRTRFLWGWDASRGAIDDPEAYTGAVRIDAEQDDVSTPSVSDLQAAEARYGRRDAAAVLLPALQDEWSAEHVAGYYAREVQRVAARRVVRGVPWTLAYDLERGDIVNFTPPWDSTPIKHRVLGVTKDTDEMCELVLAEVL